MENRKPKVGYSPRAQHTDQVTSHILTPHRRVLQSCYETVCVASIGSTLSTSAQELQPSQRHSPFDSQQALPRAATRQSGQLNRAELTASHFLFAAADAARHRAKRTARTEQRNTQRLEERKKQPYE